MPEPGGPDHDRVQRKYGNTIIAGINSAAGGLPVQLKQNPYNAGPGCVHGQMALDRGLWVPDGSFLMVTEFTGR